MPPTMWRQHLINACSELDQAERWHPRARVFWSEGPRELEQRLIGPNSLTFDSKAAADKHAIHELARPWIDRLPCVSQAPAAQEARASGRTWTGDDDGIRALYRTPASRPKRRRARRVS